MITEQDVNLAAVFTHHGVTATQCAAILSDPVFKSVVSGRLAPATVDMVEPYAFTWVGNNPVKPYNLTDGNTVCVTYPDGWVGLCLANVPDWKRVVSYTTTANPFIPYDPTLHKFPIGTRLVIRVPGKFESTITSIVIVENDADFYGAFDWRYAHDNE